MASEIDIAFASYDGQTRLIAEALEGHLRALGATVELVDLSRSADAAVRVDRVTVVAAPIRYGYPLPAANRFLRRNAGRIDERRLAVLLVNLSARKPGRETPAGNVYLRKWLKRRGLSPAIAAGVAGRLDYPHYAWYDRLMIRLIMTISGGPTDPEAVIEYTDWGQVERLADRIAALAAEG